MRLTLAVVVLLITAFSTEPVEAQPELHIEDAAPSWIHFGSVGGVAAFGVGVSTCNSGTLSCAWNAATPEHPVIARSLYRWHDDRFEQIGMGWVTHGFCALGLGGTCGTCSPTGCDSLGAGCLTSNSAATSGSASTLGPRSDVNASTGEFPFPATLSPVGNPTLAGRLQATTASLVMPGAAYFVEQQVVSADEIIGGDPLDNASWHELQVTAPSTATPVGTTGVGDPAIYAWQMLDPDVEIHTVDIAGDGRFVLASRAKEIAVNTWRYDYALFNLNSHRSARAFSLPCSSGPCGATSLYFSAPSYHSGEPFSNAPWADASAPSTLRWQGVAHAMDENANALRWGTTYSFGFVATSPPGPMTASLELFRPGVPSEVGVAAVGPVPVDSPFIRGDVNQDGAIDIGDPVSTLQALFVSGTLPSCLDAMDANDDGAVDTSDAIFEFSWLFSFGPPLPAPFPGCGLDATPDFLDCLAFAICP